VEDRSRKVVSGSVDCDAFRGRWKCTVIATFLKVHVKGALSRSICTIDAVQEVAANKGQSK
jgi:hypothetical protein